MTRSFLVPLSKSVPELQSDRSGRDPIAHLVILLVGEVLPMKTRVSSWKVLVGGHRAGHVVSGTLEAKFACGIDRE